MVRLWAASSWAAYRRYDTILYDRPVLCSLIASTAVYSARRLAMTAPALADRDRRACPLDQTIAEDDLRKELELANAGSSPSDIVVVAGTGQGAAYAFVEYEDKPDSSGAKTRGEIAAETIVAVRPVLPACSPAPAMPVHLPRQLVLTLWSAGSATGTGESVPAVQC